jgi:hypothetical protein
MSRHNPPPSQNTVQTSTSNASRHAPSRSSSSAVMSISSVLNSTESASQLRNRHSFPTETDIPYRIAPANPTHPYSLPASGHLSYPALPVAYGSFGGKGPVCGDSGTGCPRGPEIISQRRQSLPRERRAPRPRYMDEEIYFIWYWRTDLKEGWDRVLQEFWREFPRHRTKGGLQCRFYRALDQYGVEKVREQNRQMQKGKDLIGRFGVVQRTEVRYPWMRREDQCKPDPLPQFLNDRRRSLRNTPYKCEHCQHGSDGEHGAAHHSRVMRRPSASPPTNSSSPCTDAACERSQ